MKRFTLAITACIAVSAPALAGTQGMLLQQPLDAPDSALADLAAGRYWHAARRLRAAGPQSPEEILLLARAEAGWKNWDAVVELLAVADWLDDVGGGDAWYLLGRAYENEGLWSKAGGAYARDPGAAKGGVASAAAVRWVRANALMGDHGAALEALDAFGPGSEALVSWMALELAEAASEEGDTAQVAAYRERLVDSGARSAGWRLYADALLAAADTARAISQFQALMRSSSGSRRAIAATEVGLLVRAGGDTATARAILLGVLDDAPPSTAGRAAGVLVDDRGVDQTMALRL
ncbi:MAG: hypothetical protein V3S01_10980, partial [Dehalococcoidia bacterium]